MISRKIFIADAVSEAFGTFADLAEELREWEANVEEKFPAKAEQVGAAADELEALEEPDHIDWAKANEIEYTEPPRRKRGYSKPERRDQALLKLQRCIQECDEAIEAAAAGASDELQDYRDAIESLHNDAEAIEFPRAFGG